MRGFTDKQSIFTPSKFVSRVEADAPTTKLYRFHGALIHPSGERVPISTECLLLRESRLKVCKEILILKLLYNSNCSDICIKLSIFNLYYII